MLLDLESILSEWKEDAEIDRYKLDDTSIDTPKLHAKYLQYLSLTKLQLKRAEHAQRTLFKDKFMYYEGKMSQEEINSKKWQYDPFEGNIPTKAMKEKMADADTDIQRSEEKIEYLKVTISTLEEIIQTLRWRHSTIKNIIDWRRLESGG
jgi:hypothetical protein